MKAWPMDPVKFHSMQQGVIPIVGGTVELASTPEGALALSVRTTQGHVTIVTTINHLQASLEAVSGKTVESPPIEVNNPDAGVEPDVAPPDDEDMPDEADPED